MCNGICILFAVLSYLAFQCNAVTQFEGKAHRVYLHAAELDIATEASRARVRRGRRLLSSQHLQSTAWGPFKDKRQYIVAFEKDKTKDVTAQISSVLQRNSGWLGSYFPDDAVLVLGSNAAVKALAELRGVKWIGDFLPAYKTRTTAADLQQICTLERRQTVKLVASFAILHHPDDSKPKNFDPGRAAVEDWGPQLKALTVGGQVRRINGHTAEVEIACNDAEAALDWLKQHPAVHWIAPTAATAKLRNWQGTAVTQSSTAAPAAPVALSEDQGTHPLWSAGLTGNGQIIGGGDSGLDYTNCYFNDPAVDWNGSLSTDAESGVVSFNSTTHRKIRLYRSTTNGVSSTGHGTHTMSSLLGSPANTSDTYHMNYRGMAPDAKLAFNDLQGSSDETIYTPQDLATGYYNFAYEIGARVHSDSWGSSATSYDYLAAQVDLFTWQNQDFVPVIAAGNEGAALSNASGVSTVTSPATAKNCITAGATEVAGQSFITNPQYVTASMTLRQPTSTASTDIAVASFQVMQSAFGGALSQLYGQNLPLSVADPKDACTGLANAEAAKGTVLLIQRGSCLLSDKVSRAQESGAVAAIVYDNSINDYFLMLADGDSTPNISIPSASIPRKTGQLLLSSALAGGQLTVSFGESSTSPEAWANLAAFSSKGPTPDGRVKPDLLAPGTLLSAYTDEASRDTCSLRTMQGTSMATPLIAGSAALVRQYFLSGAYPTGQTNAANAFKPSGALVKAVLISGAGGLSGYEPDTGLPLAPPPSYRQGFGRVRLATSLPLQGSGMNLQLVDMANITDGETHSYCVNATGGSLAITLVWHDYPAALSASKSLVNDLDLTVRAAGLNGFPLLGNGGENGDTLGPDRTNNVEQVSLSNLPAGKVAIQVNAHKVYFGQGPQPYALVVLGNFQGVLASPFNPVNGGNNASGDCQVALAEISNAPPALTNSSNITFAFQLQNRPGVTGSFECAIEKQEQSDDTPSFSACTSPESYTELDDGEYIFSVRAQGEQVADSWSFSKDTTPPVIDLQQAFPPNSVSASEIGNFTFTAQDESSVNFSCRVNATGSLIEQQEIRAKLPNGDTLDTPVNLGTWMNCTSPLILYWLQEGNWSLEIEASDAAGNSAQQPAEHAWSIAYDEGVQYTRFQTAPLGLVNASSQAFVLQSCVGGTSSSLCSTEPTDFSCNIIVGEQAQAMAANLSSALAGLSWQDESSWANCTDLLGNFTDGDYAVAGKLGDVQSDQQLALTAFTIDSQSPVIEITSAPENVTAASTVSVEFNASEPTSFSCAVSSTGTDELQWMSCSSPQQFANLTDGEHTVHVTGRDRVWNMAQEQNVSFLVDTTPPTISNLQVPVASRVGNIVISFNASDGALGSGVKETQCRLQLLKAANESNTSTGNASFDWQPCQSPYTIKGMAAGHWALSLMPIDRAGNQQTYGDVSIWIETQAASVVVSQGPQQSIAVPSAVSFNLTAISESGLGTPIVETRCRLIELSEETAANKTELQQTSQSLPGLVIQSVSADDSPTVAAKYEQTSDMEGLNLLRPEALTAEMQGNLSLPDQAALDAPALAPAIQLQTFASEASDWSVCQSPVHYKDLGTGNYSFQALAVDAAGNVGNGSMNYIFTVDQSLPLSGQSSQFWGLGWKFWLIIGGGGAAILSVSVAIFAIALRRCKGRADHRRSHHYSPHENTVATPRVVPHIMRGSNQAEGSSSSSPMSAMRQPPSAPPLRDSYFVSERSCDGMLMRMPDTSGSRGQTPRGLTLRGSSALERRFSHQSPSQTPRFDPDTMADVLRDSIALHKSRPHTPRAGSPRIDENLVEEARIRQAVALSLLSSRSPRRHDLPPLRNLHSLESRVSSMDSARSSDGDERALLASHRSRETPRTSRLQGSSRQ